MKAISINASSRKILRSLMDPSRLDLGSWSPDDLRAILEHQLCTPLRAEDEHFKEAATGSPPVVSVLDTHGGMTFGELLELASPPGDALRLVKDYAKASLTTEGDLPPEVARVLYTLVVLVARRAGDCEVTSLDDEAAAREGHRCLTLAWLPVSVASRFRRLLSF